MFWANPSTGLSPHVLAGAVGWYVMALVDILETLENEDVHTQALIDLLKEAVDGMLCYQHYSGMWTKLLNEVDEKAIT